MPKKDFKCRDFNQNVHKIKKISLKQRKKSVAKIY